MPADPSTRRLNWTTLADLRTLSMSAWNRGELLRELLAPSETYPRRRSLKRPTAVGLRTDFPGAQAWAASLFSAARSFSLETVDVGRTTVGVNRLPAAAVFATVDDEIAFIGMRPEADRFRRLAEDLTRLDPAFRRWLLRRPQQLLKLAEAALTAARVALWLRDNPQPGIYVRQLTLPGIHTKFIEGHRRVIDELAAELACPGEADVLGTLDDVGEQAEDSTHRAALDGTAAGTPAARFAQRHGFLHPPELVRFRLLDPATTLLGDARDLTVTAEAFATLRMPIETVIVTENLVNFLALPERHRTLALFGKGYGFSALRDASWLRHCTVLYWGDLDTHGFQILDQLRAVHPHVESVLMDEATLLAHREVWGSEPSPSRAVLGRLTADEADLYTALGHDIYGPAVRLEQEHIEWGWATGRLLPDNADVHL